MEPQPSLPKLLAALALGARSVNSLPFSSSANGGGDSDDEVEDDFEYSMSLPEFAALNHEARQLMTSLLRETLEIISPTTNNYDDLEFDDPALWESCADACDELRDRVMSYLPNANAGQRPDIMNLASKVDSAKQTALSKAAGSYSRMVNSLADMEKPQHIFQGFVTHPPQNTRGEPFVPIIFDAAKQARLDAGEYNVSGHGLETRHNDGRNESGERDATKRKYASDMIAPTYHIDHPYRDEIETLEYRPWQLSTDGIQKDVLPSLKANDDQGVWIGTEAELALLCKKITEEDIQEIALDLEAHSHRSFAGFICLIQLSIRRPETGGDKGEQYDYLIDALSLRHVISSYIGPILANPNILKVMHGADSDVPWLQRDFGSYIVNLFDTGRASRALKYPSAGLAYLLRKYCGINADKQHQLSDWRRRPLPEDMRTYALSDTRYLLDIYDQLRLELDTHSSPDVSIEVVLDRSKQVCLVRYDKEPFQPSAYKSIINKGRRGGKVVTQLTQKQDASLKALYDWRDATARKEDESIFFVCPNASLVRIASNHPKTVNALQRLLNPTPPLVMRRSQEILDALSSLAANAKPSIGTRLPPATAGVGGPNVQVPSHRNREMLSPILVSDALFDTAGWTSNEQDDVDEGTHLLDVSHLNEGFKSNTLSSHSLELSPPDLHTENTLRRGMSTSGVSGSDARVAKRSASMIHDQMMLSGHRYGGSFSLLDLIRPNATSSDLDREEKEPAVTSKPAVPEEEEMQIPKSIGEIFRLSNANRGKQKKSKPQFTSQGNKSMSMKEDDVQAAEGVIESYGGSGGYFGHKRQRPGKDGDIKQLIKLGWVKDQADADELGKASEQPEQTKSPMDTMVGAYNPNSTPSKANPFFQGAARRR